VNYSKGEIYGLHHDPNRFDQTFLRPQTPIKNLYLTGQDILTAGVAGALMAGVLTIKAINKEDYVSKILRQVLAKRKP
jgi:all-trans-retinol 13,14-reductase